ncbi:MAG: carboxylesterase family protein [Alphaproteobacteria bacterium]|nr:carboxylesterase family protein [Alphaproteobacteria bacterium]
MGVWKGLFAVGALLMLAAWTAVPAAAQTAACEGEAYPTAKVGNTTFCGIATSSRGADISAYLGIRYGTAARWERAVFASDYQNEETIPAQAYGDICPQPGFEVHPTMYDMRFADPIQIQQWQSEDCLFLNVWATKDASNAPVMVFIHGGAFITGSSSAGIALDPETKRLDIASGAYNGQGLVAAAEAVGQQLVVVTINYRLGALGFFYHDARGETSAPGNFGITDQRLALQWVHNHIGAFGGDNGQVTIFGESAGAMSVGLLAFNTDGEYGGGNTAPLFRGAIMESNPLNVPYRQDVQVQSQSGPIGILDQVNLESCLLLYNIVDSGQPVDNNCSYSNGSRDNRATFDYNKSYEQIKNDPSREMIGEIIGEQLNLTALLGELLGSPSPAKWYAILPWTPFVGDYDQVLFDSQPGRQGFNPDATPIPILIGTNRDEGDLFVDMMRDPKNQVSLLLNALYPTVVNSLLEVPASASTANQELVKVTALSPETGAKVNPYCGNNKGGSCANFTSKTSGFVATETGVNLLIASRAQTAFSQVATDLVFRCGTATAATQATLRGKGVSMYVFSHKPEPQDNVFPGSKVCNVHDSDQYQAVCHGYEIPFVFSSGGQTGGITPMTEDWAAFAADPDGFTADHAWTPNAKLPLIYPAKDDPAYLNPWMPLDQSIEQAAHCEMWNGKVVPTWFDDLVSD